MRGDNWSLIITHYQRLLNYIEPDVVHIMMDESCRDDEEMLLLLVA